MHAPNLDLWVDYLCGQPVPVFHHTVKSILKLCADEQTSCKQLADTILRDPVFTARVLSIANSAYYNRSAEPLTDIRRAVLLIGFNKIVGISLTVSIVDTFVNKSTLQHIVMLIERAILRAMLARAVAEAKRLSNCDDIFVAGLLLEFGEIAFWSLTGPSSRDIRNRFAALNLSDHSVQREILGTTFDEITEGLNTRWKLSPLLSTVLRYPYSTDTYAQCLAVSHAVTCTLGNNGHTYQPALAALARYAGLTFSETEELVQQQLVEAEELNQYFFRAR